MLCAVAVLCCGLASACDSTEENPCEASPWTFSTIDAAQDAGDSPFVLLDSSGGLHVLYGNNQAATENDRLWYGYRAAGEESWTLTPVNAPYEGGFDPAVAFGETGDVHVAYAAPDAHQTQVAVGRPHGPWTVEILDADHAATKLSIAVKGGTIYVAFIVSEVSAQGAGVLSKLQLATSTTPGTWTIETLLSQQYSMSDPSVCTGDCVGSYLGLLVTAEGVVHLAVGNQGLLGHMEWYPGGSWVGENVDSVTAGEGIPMLLDSLGDLHMVYGDTGGNLKHAQYGLSTNWIRETVAAADGAFPSFTIADHGFINIIYVKDTSTFRHAYRWPAFGWNDDTMLKLEQLGSLGYAEYSHVAADGAGNVSVVYKDESRGLKLAQRKVCVEELGLE